MNRQTNPLRRPGGAPALCRCRVQWHLPGKGKENENRKQTESYIGLKCELFSTKCIKRWSTWCKRWLTNDVTQVASTEKAAGNTPNAAEGWKIIKKNRSPASVAFPPDNISSRAGTAARKTQSQNDHHRYRPHTGERERSFARSSSRQGTT